MKIDSHLLKEMEHQLGHESGTETETETEDDAVSSDHVRVVIRCRPLNRSKEKDGGSRVSISHDGKSIDVNSAAVGPRGYHFACVADESKDQEYMFRKTGKHIVECALAGFNGAIVAYGQTGSGKTFTMQGPGLVQTHSSTSLKSQGIIQSVCEMIFAHIQESEEDEAAVKFRVSASYLEIYNEKLIDLLAVQDIKHKPKTTKLNIREDSKGEIIVVGQNSITVQTPKDCYKLLRDGAQQRHVGATKMNSESSRSHAVFTLRIEKTDSERGTRQTSRLHLVDLAGSERQKGTGATGMRLTEASGINKSLSALGNVVNALAAIESSRGKGATRVRIPSCRDSKLTFLLKDSLGGNSKLCIIATISPAINSVDETVSTLEFAKRCTAVRNEAVVNESLTEDVAALQAEVLRLQQSMKQLRLNLSKAKTVEMELRVNAQPSKSTDFYSGDLRSRLSCTSTTRKMKQEAGVQTEEGSGNQESELYALNSVRTADLTSALDSLVERELEGETEETKVEKLCKLLSNAISREKGRSKRDEEMKRKVDDSHKRWIEMLTSNKQLMETLNDREAELNSIRKNELSDGKDQSPRRLQNELETLQTQLKSNPELVLFRHRVAALEAELEIAQNSGSLSEEAKRMYEQQVSESDTRWLEMLQANNELMIALNEREKVLNGVREKGLKNVYGDSGTRLRKDFDLLQKEIENNPEKDVLNHRIVALEKELLEFAELSAEAQKEALESAHTGTLGERSRTVEFATEIGGEEDGLSEEGVMRSLNKIPESFRHRDFADRHETSDRRGRKSKSGETNGDPETQPAPNNCGKTSTERGVLDELLSSEPFREIQDCSIEDFRYDNQSPRRTSELDACLEDLDSSVQGLFSWASKGGINSD